jgi:surface polysaccharide O-acyltransferase-like enzyme
MKYICYIICGALLFSCASRKVDVKKIEIKKDSLIETKIDLTENKVKDSIAETNINKIVYFDEITIKPLDSCKEFIVEGKTYKNVVLSYKKTKTNTLYNNKIKVSENTLKRIKTDSKIKTSTKENIKEKQIDKKANYFIYLWFILGIIILYLIWRSKRLFL